MGKGGMSDGDHADRCCGEAINGDVQQENMAAWLLGVRNLKIQPYKLPNLGIYFFSCFD